MNVLVIALLPIVLISTVAQASWTHDDDDLTEVFKPKTALPKAPATQTKRPTFTGKDKKLKNELYDAFLKAADIADRLNKLTDGAEAKKGLEDKRKERTQKEQDTQKRIARESQQQRSSYSRSSPSRQSSSSYAPRQQPSRNTGSSWHSWDTPTAPARRAYASNSIPSWKSESDTALPNAASSSPGNIASSSSSSTPTQSKREEPPFYGTALSKKDSKDSQEDKDLKRAKHRAIGLHKQATDELTSIKKAVEGQTDTEREVEYKNFMQTERFAKAKRFREERDTAINELPEEEQKKLRQRFDEEDRTTFSATLEPLMQTLAHDIFTMTAPAPGGGGGGGELKLSDEQRTLNSLIYTAVTVLGKTSSVVTSALQKVDEAIEKKYSAAATKTAAVGGDATAAAATTLASKEKLTLIQSTFKSLGEMQKIKAAIAAP